MAETAPPDFSLSEALTPFCDEEVRRLRRYVQLAEDLKQSRFFGTLGKLEININQEGMSIDHPQGEDEELVTVMVTRLRKLHSRGEPGSASFKRTLRMLREHAETRDNASAEWFRHVLQSHQTALEEINRTSLIGLVREQVDSEGNVVSTEKVSPAETFWDWVYGVYLHDGEDKLARVESWRPISLHKFNFLHMATDLSRLYYAFSGIVREVLAVPTLVPPASSKGS